MPNRYPALAVVDLKLVAVKAALHGKDAIAVNTPTPQNRSNSPFNGLIVAFSGGDPRPGQWSYAPCATGHPERAARREILCSAGTIITDTDHLPVV